MKRKKYTAAALVLLIVAMILGGCAGLLPDSAGDDSDGGRSEQSREADSRDYIEQEDGDSEKYSFLEEGSGFFYRTLDDAEKIWYRDMERILGNFETETKLSDEGLEEGLDENSIDKIFQCVLNDHPELFYVEGYSYVKYAKYQSEDDILSVEFSGKYSVDKETAKQRQAMISEAVDEILKGIDSGAGEYEKVKYVYDTLIRETDYSLDAEDNQNIYSVFVNHVSVCQGYAKATQYLLNRMGVECALVQGTVNTGEGHAWNIVNIDGSYYYVDTTWGDASYQLGEDGSGTVENIPEINYDYLNVTTRELLRTHEIDSSQRMPECTDTAANYYVKEGALFYDYDRDQMAELFQRNFENGRNDITIKCATGECYESIVDAMIDGQEIFDYINDSRGSIAYTKNDEQMSLTFWVTKE